MVKIRLTRLGRHKKPFYRIVAIDSRTKINGSYLAQIGTYEPFSGKVNINTELTLKFLNNGAIPSDTVLNVLKKKGIYQQFLQNKKTKNKSKKKRSDKKNVNNKTKKVSSKKTIENNVKQTNNTVEVKK